MSKGPEAEKMLACVGQKFGWELGCPNWISRFMGDPWEMQWAVSGEDQEGS